MRILVNRGDKWTQVERQPASEEVLLERLIQESPEVIPPDPDVDFEVYARQFSCPPNYSIDLVGVGSDGGISIVECKLARNTQAKREVVGQILEYAAGLWGMDVEEFERRFADADGRLWQREGRSPYAMLQEQGPMDAEAVADCQRRVAANLEAGRFRLLIAVDDFTDELKSIIRYVNGHSGGQLTLVALALPEFTDGSTRLLIPETFGNEAAPPKARDDSPVPADIQFSRCLPEWRPSLELVHRALTERLEAKPTHSSIRYYAPDSPKPVATMWPGEGRLYSGPSGRSAFETLLASAKAMGIPVGTMSVKFVAASPEDLAPLTDTIRQQFSAPAP